MKKLATIIALMFSCGASDYAYEHLHAEGYQLIRCTTEGTNSGVACNPDVACEPVYDRRDR